MPTNADGITWDSHDEDVINVWRAKRATVASAQPPPSLAQRLTEEGLPRVP